MFVYSRHKYHVPNIRHMIYDYHSLCLCIRDIKTGSIMFDIIYDHRSSCFCHRDKNRVLDVRQMIYDHRSVSVSLPDQNTMSVRHIIYDHRSLYSLSNRDKNGVLNSLFCVLQI